VILSRNWRLYERSSSLRNEALLGQGHHPEPTIPERILEKWHNIVNLMAEMVDVPAGVIMRIQVETYRFLCRAIPNGRLIVDLTPELGLIIGQQPPVQGLAPRDSQRRFQLAFWRGANAGCGRTRRSGG
jgi:hypothetical protein